VVSKKTNSNWWAQCDAHNIVYIYLISVDYKNYLAGELMAETEKTLSTVDEYYKKSPKEIYN